MFPTRADTAFHGVQIAELDRLMATTATIPVFDASHLDALRNPRLCVRSWHSLSVSQVKEALAVIGEAFARWEPVVRHLLLPAEPVEFKESTTRHSDGLEQGVTLGEWTAANLTAWWTREHFVVDATQPGAPLQHDTLLLSLAVVAPDGSVTTSYCLHKQSPPDASAPDAAAPTIHTFLKQCYFPLDALLECTTNEGFAALCKRFPDFVEAWQAGCVVEGAMLGKAAHVVDKREPLEIFYRAFFHCQALGYRYLFVLATSHWTGAIMEAMGAVRVSFEPFQGKISVPLNKDGKALGGSPSSSNGWLSDKDSGVMMYVVALAATTQPK